MWAAQMTRSFLTPVLESKDPLCLSFRFLQEGRRAKRRHAEGPDLHTASFFCPGLAAFSSKRSQRFLRATRLSGGIFFFCSRVFSSPVSPCLFFFFSELGPNGFFFCCSAGAQLVPERSPPLCLLFVSFVIPSVSLFLLRCRLHPVGFPLYGKRFGPAADPNSPLPVPWALRLYASSFLSFDFS